MADPTIVLVHGAFADASSWSRLYAELAGDGLMIKAPPNPLRGVTVEDAEYARRESWPGTGRRAAGVIYGNVPTSPVGASSELQATAASQARSG